jgi:predicted alpha/beta superfamily hydrolase
MMQPHHTSQARIAPSWLLIAIAVATNAYSGEPADIGVGTRHKLASQVLNESRNYLVHTPEGYDFSSERYPVLILLDADGNFSHTCAAVDFLANENRIPPMLVIGITNTNRRRDLTPPTAAPSTELGGADQFLAFVADELIPSIDKQYRTLPYRVLVGHSLGGLIAIYALQHRPAVFNGYVAISPSMWWDEDALVKTMRTFLVDHPSLSADLYMTLGEEGAQMLNSVQKLTSVLSESAPAGLHWQFRLQPNETHNSNRYRSTYDGLEAIFNGWYIPNPLPLYEQAGVNGLVEHYAKLSTRTGFAVTPPTNAVERIFRNLLQEQRFAEAEAILQAYRQWHPKEFVVYYQAATLLASAMHDDERTIEYASRWLTLAPGSAGARRTLEEHQVDPETLVPTIAVPAKVLTTYVGEYRAGNTTIGISRQDAKLFATSDEGQYELRARKFDPSGTTFYFVNVPFEARIQQSISGKLTLQYVRGTAIYTLNKEK